MNQQLVVAIDGPSGSGKSSVAKALATKLNLLYIDTGAMFRAIALSANLNNIKLDDNSLSKYLDGIDIKYGESANSLISVNGNDLTDKIREHHVSKLASIVSQFPSVRNFLLDFQRSLVSDRYCVMEGRDIGSVVFPDAFIKFFVTASLEVRSERRFHELKKKGEEVSLEKVMADQKLRDETDTNRKVAPLVQAEDAIFVDTGKMTLTEVVEHLSDLVLKRKNNLQ